MFGEPGQTTAIDDNSTNSMDPVVMADPSSMPAMGASQPMPANDHMATPAYPTDNDYATTSPIPADDTASAQVSGDNDDGADSASLPDSPHPDDELLGIKQDALNALSPLVGQLDQTAEEKFRTTMMMIQASDDRNLVRTAYEAAQAIEDEKTRAQALLDVINEINYFTSQHEG